jgi:hypothetical protein
MGDELIFVAIPLRDEDFSIRNWGIDIGIRSSSPLCGIATGMAIVANILPGVRAVALYNLYTSERAKVSNNARDHSGKKNKES